MQIALNVDDLTLGEIEEMEQAAGLKLSELGNGSARSTIALIWISQRRIDPAFTLDDARALKVTELEFANPTVAGDS
ncbi:MAG: hypothetical protein PHS80_11970 [Methanothrix sp.]|nr:hypothetical protein [Methanothrix sp.]